MRLSNDLIFDILSSYVLMPWLSKPIYNICINGKIYKEAYKEKIIERFIQRIDIEKAKKITNWDKVGKYNLSLVPSDKITIKMLKQSIPYHKNDSIISHIPEHLMNEESISLDLTTLYDVPNKLRTREICKKAIQLNGFNIIYVPEEYIDQEFYDILLSNPGASIFKIPPHLITREIVNKVVENCPLNLFYVPIQMIDRELCIKAIKLDEQCIKYVPENIIDEELCMMAINNNINAVHYIVQDTLKQNILRKLNDSLSLQDKVRYGLVEISDIDEDEITEEMCNIHIDIQNRSMISVPEHLQTREMWIKSISYNEMGYWELPDIYKDMEFHTEIVKNNPLVIEYLDDVRYNEKWYQLDPANAAYMGEQYINRFIKEFDL